MQRCCTAGLGLLPSCAFNSAPGFSYVHLLGPSGNMLGSILSFSFPPVLSERLFIMNLTFIPVVVALTGLFGLASALYGALTCKRGRKPGKRQPNQPTGGLSSSSTVLHVLRRTPTAVPTRRWFHLSDTRPWHEYLWPLFDFTPWFPTMSCH